VEDVGFTRFVGLAAVFFDGEGDGGFEEGHGGNGKGGMGNGKWELFRVNGSLFSWGKRGGIRFGR
jgi:hypothetical protein